MFLKILCRRRFFFTETVTGFVVLQEVKLVLPNSQRINRGNYKKTALTEACIDQKITDLILLKEHRGRPG